MINQTVGLVLSVISAWISSWCSMLEGNSFPGPANEQPGFTFQQSIQEPEMYSVWWLEFGRPELNDYPARSCGMDISQQIALLLSDEQNIADSEFLELIQCRYVNRIAIVGDVFKQQNQALQRHFLITASTTSFQAFEDRLNVLLGEFLDVNAPTSITGDFDISSTLAAIGVHGVYLELNQTKRRQRKHPMAPEAEIGDAITEAFRILQHLYKFFCKLQRRQEMQPIKSS